MQQLATDRDQKKLISQTPSSASFLLDIHLLSVGLSYAIMLKLNFILIQLNIYSPTLKDMPVGFLVI